MLYLLIALYIIAFMFEKSRKVFTDNIYAQFLLMFITGMIVYKYNKEDFTGTLSNEAIQNIGSVYNPTNMTVANLTVTGTLTVTGASTFTGGITGTTMNVTGTATIGGNTVITGTLTTSDNTTITGNLVVSGTGSFGPIVKLNTVDLRQYVIGCILFDMNSAVYDGTANNGFLSSPYYFTVGSYNFDLYGNDAFDVIIVNPGFKVEVFVAWNGGLNEDPTVQVVENRTATPKRVNLDSVNSASSIRVSMI